MENINITVEKATRKVDLTKSVIGNDGENLQENIVFSFSDEFVDGQGRLEIIKPNKTKSYIFLTKIGETYQLPVKSVLTKIGKLDMQLVITEGTNEEEIPIFKSNMFYMVVNKSINAVEEEPEGFPTWLDILEEKINEVNAALLDLQQKVDSGYFNGKDALINGYNVLDIIAGQNIILEQDENTLTISAIGVTPYPDNHLETVDGDIFKTYDDAYFIVKESD